MNGYMGKLLRIDLSNQTTKTETISAGTCSKVDGWRGFCF